MSFGAVSERRGFSGWAWALISVLWFLAGISAAIYRAMKEHNADTTVLGFLVFAFAAFLVPIISNLELPGGTKIQFSAEASDSVTVLQQSSALAVTDIAQLMRSLVVAQTRIAAIFRLGAMDRATAYTFGLQTLVDAMSACTAWLVPQPSDGAPPEHVRVTLWRWDEPREQLVFVTGTVTSNQSASLSRIGLFVTDDDYIGEAWRNARISNHAGAPDDWRALSHGRDPAGFDYPDPVTFGGVMFVPVLDDGRRAGLLQVDRVKAIRFDVNAEVVAASLAELVSAVLGHQLVQWGQTA